MQAVHERWTGDGAGWDRWLDNHLGLAVTSGALDRFGRALVAGNVSYQARAGAAGDTGATSAAGSVWTSGFGGQGVELHGNFDWSFFDPNATSGMDYCGSPSLAGVLPREARHDGGGAANASRASNGTEGAGGSGRTPRTAPTTVR